MPIYTELRPSATKRSTQNSSNRSDAFAKAALGEVFRDRDLRLAREPGFVDHPPHRLGEIIDQVAAEAGEKAVRYWQKRAALALGLTERAEALSIARKIALKASLEFPEDRERAA